MITENLHPAAVPTGRRRRNLRGGLVTILTCSVLVGCTSQTKRIDVDDDRGELGTGPSSKDLRSVAQRMARSIIALPQIQNSENPPRIAFVQVANKSNEYIDGDMVLRQMRTLLIEHAEGRLQFLDREIIERIERENRDKRLGKRTASDERPISGADFFLTGVIDSLDRRADEGHTTYLRFAFRLTDAADSVIAWEHSYEIKKHSVLGLVYR